MYKIKTMSAGFVVEKHIDGKFITNKGYFPTMGEAETRVRGLR